PTRPVVLELRHVTCRYADRPAIHDISLSALEGEIICVLGPSGCGKTTTLRAIAGFEPVTSGEVVLENRVMSAPGRIVPAEERRVGMVFQDYALFPHLRVVDNIAFGLRHLSAEARAHQVNAMLTMVGLTGLEQRYPHELSGGQQQRVALARALAPKPSVLLLDEPFSNLDPDMTGRMREDLHELLRRTTTTTLLVTHDHEEAFAMADRVAVLNNGCLEQFDTPETIYHTPSTPFVADFVGQADFIPGNVQSGKVLTEIGEFPNQEGYADGTKVVVMIRPDDIHVIPADDGPGRLIARQFRGSENLYRVELPSGHLVHSSEPSTSVFPVGTPVRLRVIATHTVLFPLTDPVSSPPSAR
ncbi:MAG TPA: ABC transporter ATP-binding protein, partial [Nitrospirales bacterium]|nr:ABC transporter ATP-binding protein [Nitrospirales bacterium]